ncbi:MAG TPA: FecR domain-containing protein [Gemmatimonadaceae bacterium]|jgi:transmembrane sensor
MTAESSSSPLPPDWDAIARFLAGESTDEEAARVQQWLEENPADRALAEQLDEALKLDAPDASVPTVDVESALALVHSRMGEAASPKLGLERGGATRTTLNSRSAGRGRTFGIIAGLIAAGIVAVVVTRRTPTATSPTTGRVMTYATGVGKRDSVRLADGSRVVLGPQSRLVVPSEYGNATRSVELSGDAYFEVEHNAARPFSVRANGAVIEDIGTTFAVESDVDGAVTSVAVVTGSVRLRTEASAPTAGVVLAAGDRGTLDAAGKARVERDAVREDDVAWTTGRLVFNDAPLARVIPELQRWYGVTIRVSDSALLRRTVHTSFNGESADKALEILGLTLGARIERHGDTATVIATGPASRAK